MSLLLAPGSNGAAGSALGIMVRWLAKDRRVSSIGSSIIKNASPARTIGFLSGPKPTMNSLDNKITEMQNQLALLHRQREAARLERAKSYVDAFIRKLEADDIALTVGLKAFQDLSKFSSMKSTSGT